MTKPRSIIFFDVDGTISGFNAEAQTDKVAEPVIRPSVFDAFARLRENGHVPLICTGRPRVLIGDGLKALNPCGFVINGGGALMVDDELVFERTNDNALMREFIKRTFEYNAHPMIESNERSLELSPDGSETPYVPGMEVVHSADDLGFDAGKKYCKICLYYDVLMQMNGDGFIDDNFTLCKTGAGRAEITPKGVDKGYGVRKALEYFGFEGNANSYGLGDSGNDLAMLEAVETAIAMGNSMPEVFEVADYVTADVMDDGAAKALEHFGLI